MQTILGAGGAAGTELAKALTDYTKEIRLVSRHPQPVNPGDTTLQADLLDAYQVDEAVSGSSVVYLMVGFPYKARIWQQAWPQTMQHVIAACEKHQARLVFFLIIYTCTMLPTSTKWTRTHHGTRPVKKGRCALP